MYCVFKCLALQRFTCTIEVRLFLLALTSVATLGFVCLTCFIFEVKREVIFYKNYTSINNKEILMFTT